MTGTSRVTLGWSTVITSAVVLLALGATATYVLVGLSRSPTGRPEQSESSVAATAQRNVAATAVPGPAVSQGALSDVAITLTPDAIQRAGIRTGQVQSGIGASRLRLPGVVDANAYQQIVVTSLVGGRVTRVLVELGQSVRAGQAMAEIFSPELAEAETRYISARAELDAHERQLQRTERLVELGAASRQELEMLHAEHTAKLTAVDSARSRLEVLGISRSTAEGLGPGSAVNALITVAAPIAGLVIERNANRGLNVDAAAKLFTVADLSTIWVVADLYEKDFATVHVGSSATVTTQAYPDLVVQGRVSYIDPQVATQTRTAKIRIEVPNPRQALRIGMFADVTIETASQVRHVRIPKSAVQHVGDRTVVYLADSTQPGRFIEREVRLGEAAGSEVEVLSGVQEKDTVVAEGSFYVRAERERLGLRP